MIKIPVSVGELIDKLSILQIKRNKIKDPEKLALVSKEFEFLYNLSSIYLNEFDIEKIYHELVNVNNSLWEIEDKLRISELHKDFNEEFILLARNVYITNDKRFELKNKINLLTSSEIREVKDYVNYIN